MVLILLIFQLLQPFAKVDNNQSWCGPCRDSGRSWRARRFYSSTGDTVFIPCGWCPVYIKVIECRYLKLQWLGQYAAKSDILKIQRVGRLLGVNSSLHWYGLSCTLKLNLCLVLIMDFILNLTVYCSCKRSDILSICLILFHMVFLGRGWRPSYRNVLLSVRKKLNIRCSSKLSTEDLEVEIFLHLLQDYSRYFS